MHNSLPHPPHPTRLRPACEPQFSLQEEEEDQGGVRIAVSRYVQRNAAQKKAGVYAIYNSSGKAQYIGFARSILSAVKVNRLGGWVRGDYI
jgi:hypothetical protein